MKCPNCRSDRIFRGSFCWVNSGADGVALSRSTLQVTIKCATCGFAGVYPDNDLGGEEVGKWE